MIRLDSLKSISHQNREAKEHGQALDKIDEDNAEDDDGTSTPSGKVGTQKSGNLTIK